MTARDRSKFSQRSARSSAPLTRTVKRATRTPKVPKTMLAAAIDRFGDASVLTPHELPVPKIAPDEVLIATHTAGVASWDAQMRDGWRPSKAPARFPMVLGSDGSGIIAAVGTRVRRFKPGDQVFAFEFDGRKGGFYAEFVAVPAKHVARLPAGLTLEKAGVIAAVGLTALQGIDDALHVKKGEHVVVLGGSGGVGSLGVQFAKRRGAHVLAVASGRDGVALARRLGADIAVDGKSGADVVAAAINLFAPDGIDAILALFGGPALSRCLDALKPRGRFAYPNGIEPAPRKRAGINPRVYDARAGVRELARLTRAIEEAHLEVPIAAEYSLRNAARAHERIEARHVPGKVALRVR